MPEQKHIIWSNIDLDLDDWYDDLHEEYEDGKAKRIKTIVVSVQHSKKKPFEELENEIRNEVLPIALSVFPADEDTEILINPAGCFNIGGPEGDTGLTRNELSRTF